MTSMAFRKDGTPPDKVGGGVSFSHKILVAIIAQWNASERRVIFSPPSGCEVVEYVWGLWGLIKDDQMINVDWNQRNYEYLEQLLCKKGLISHWYSPEAGLPD